MSVSQKVEKSSLAEEACLLSPACLFLVQAGTAQWAIKAFFVQKLSGICLIFLVAINLMMVS